MLPKTFREERAKVTKIIMIMAAAQIGLKRNIQ